MARLPIRAVPKKKCVMRISRFGIIGLSMLVAAMVGFNGPAFAFDASKALNGDPASNQVFEFFFSFKKKGQPEEALNVLKYAAENGNSAAQWKLGRMYQTGDGVKKDPLAAFRFYQKIVSRYPDIRPNSPDWQFSANAMVALGNYYRVGIPDTSVQADSSKAKMMYTTAAMVFRHPDAQFELGRMQLMNDNGFGQGKLGIRNLGLAYEKGHVGAEALLGYAVFEGTHVRRDPVQGLVMLENASRRANENDLAWIGPLRDEAFALAMPEERRAATNSLQLRSPLE